MGEHRRKENKHNASARAKADSLGFLDSNASNSDMTESARILLVDDDARICRTLRLYLKREGYRVSIASNGDEMWRLFEAESPDVILLDVILPGADGVTLARELRKVSDVGIIMLTGKNDPVDQIVGLEMGADDYVTKPFDERQLLARIRSLLRRRSTSNSGAAAAAEPDRHKLRFDDWEMDIFRHELVSPTGEQLVLTSHEFRLLEIFVRNPGAVLSRDVIVQRLYQRDWSQNDRSIDVLVGKLRKKIEDDPSAPRFVLTIRNFGYKFAARVAWI